MLPEKMVLSCILQEIPVCGLVPHRGIMIKEKE